MKAILLPLTLGLLFTLTACAPKPPVATAEPTPPAPTAPALPTPTPPVVPTAPTVETPPAPTPAVRPAPEWGELEDSLTQHHPDKGDVVLLEGYFSLPYIENAAGVASYEAFNDDYRRLLEDMKNDLLGELAQALDDYETATALGDPFSPYSVEQAFEVVYHSERAVSVLRTHYGFSDSPYPTLLYMADRFDMETGARLNFMDFFTDEAEAAGQVKAEVLCQAASHADYNQATVDSAFQRENFYLTEAGFVFYYQAQTLNTDAAVRPEFTIPYDLLEGLLRE